MQADYYVLSNADINPMPHFYASLYQQATNGTDGFNILKVSGKSSERHAEGARPPRRQTNISVILGLLSQSRS